MENMMRMPNPFSDDPLEGEYEIGHLTGLTFHQAVEAKQKVGGQIGLCRRGMTIYWDEKEKEWWYLSFSGGPYQKEFGGGCHQRKIEGLSGREFETRIKDMMSL